MHVHRLNILLVHADYDMRLYLRSCLRNLQPPPECVIESADGIEALRIARAGVVDLVIADVALPGFDGYRLRRAIRDDTGLHPVAVVLLDGDVDAQPDARDADARDARALDADARDADAILNGPFNGQRLLEMLHALVGRM